VAASIVVAASLALVVESPAYGARSRIDPIWYTPNPGSLDLLRMFERPDEWPSARGMISVFQFTQQHTFPVPPPIVGPNNYDALARAGAFRKLRQWRIKTAVGVGPIKEFNCVGPSALDAVVRDTLDSIQVVQAAGGFVHYLAMDEPFLSASRPRCYGPQLEPAADRLAAYVRSVRERFPLTRVGLIEAYPSFTPDHFDRMLQLMLERGIPPAFLHLDIDLRSVTPGRQDFAADLTSIQSSCAALDVPFGIIIWGYNGDADALFASDAAKLAGAVREVFKTWDQMPDQFVFESWSPSSTGLNITPSNLPESRPYTLTNLLVHMSRRFRGAGPATGVAVPRRR
jgi:hypothetical protein